MKPFSVAWKIDVEAETPIGAAMEARKIQQDSSSTATVFEVTDEAGNSESIDFEELLMCPNCGKGIEYLEVSKQMEGTRHLPDAQGAHDIVWKPENEQYEEEIYTCPECLAEIDNKELEQWGYK